jgi:hypothetical protein
MKVHGVDTAHPSLADEYIYYGTTGWIYPAWLRSCILGSTLALAISGLISVLVSTHLAQYRSGVYSLIAAGAVGIAAVLEGALIGYLQWRVLRRLFPTMTSILWVGATMIAATSGYALSWLPTSYALTAALATRIGDTTVMPFAMARISIVTGALVGLVWGVTQFAVLRFHVHRAGSWIGASMISWTLSFVWVYLAAFLPDRTTNPFLRIGLAALSGLVLGSFLGVVHGHVLTKLRSRLLVPECVT